MFSELSSWPKAKADTLKEELDSLKKYVLNLDPGKSLALVQYYEFDQLKEKEEHDKIPLNTVVKFMNSLSG